MSFLQSGGGGGGGFDEGGGGFGPPLTIGDFIDGLLNQDKGSPWDRRSIVERLFRDLGCNLAAFDAAWSAGGRSRKDLKRFAKDVLLHGRVAHVTPTRDKKGKLRFDHGLPRSKGTIARRQSFDQAGDYFRKNPDRYDTVRRVLQGQLPVPCPGGGGGGGGGGRPPAIPGRGPGVLGRSPSKPSIPTEALPSTTPRGGTQRPPGPLQQRSIDSLLQLIEQIRAWWFAREQLKAQEEAARRARRSQEAMQMAGLSDFLGGFVKTLEVAAPIATSVIEARAARDVQRANRRQAGGGFNIDPRLIAGGGGFGGGMLPGGGVVGGPPPFMPRQTAGVGDLLPLVPGMGDAIMNLFPGGGGGGGDAFYRVSPTGRVTAQREILRQNPRTGALQGWRYMGRPLVFEGDVRACKGVKKIARTTASAVGLRFRHAPRRRR